MDKAERYVYVVDDDLEVRKSLHFLLATASVRSWPFASGQDFVAQLPDLTPAPVLLDIRMPGMDGFDVIGVMNARDLYWPKIVMTGHGDVPVAVRAMKMGAAEFIEKPFSADDVEAALERGFLALEAEQKNRAHARATCALFDTLSDREREVISGLLKGLPNKLVAHSLDLSVRTVQMHRRNAMSKLGRKSLPEIALLLSAASKELEMA